MRRLKRWTAALCALVLMVSAIPGAGAFEYKSTCPDCKVDMVCTPVQPTCIDDGYIQLECPVCHGKGTAHGALGIYGIENNGKAYGHTYDMREGGVCSRCNDDARPPQTRPGMDSAYLTGPDGHAHDYRLMGNMYARQDSEGHKKWVCQTCQAVLMEDVPCLDTNGMAQPGSTFRIPGSNSGGSTTNPGGTTTNPGGTTTNPGGTANPGGSTTNPGEITNPGGSDACDHAKQPASGWTYETEKATCAKEGRSYRVCKKCGFEETLSTLKMLDHTWEQKTEPAAVGKEGRTYRVCTVCGKEETLSTTEALKPEVSTGIPGHSDRGNPLQPKGSGYELIRLAGDRIMDGSANRTQETVISDTRKIVVDSYDSEFKKTGTQELALEMDEIGAFYYGQNYNFIVFGQDNLEESSSKEILRIVKYSKDWQRLGAGSLKSAKVTAVLDQFGNFSFAECNGMLYVHTVRQTNTLNDGIRHQTNMTFCVRESDMAITDQRIEVWNPSTGYASHSFAQDIMVDSLGNLVTLDTGDGHPRGALLFRYPKKAGGESFTGQGKYVLLAKWPGGTGDNTTGANTCDLAEISQGYLSVYTDTKLGSNSVGNSVANAYLVFTPRDNFTDSASVTRPLTSLGPSGGETVGNVYLIPTGMDGGYLFWYTVKLGSHGFYDWSDESKHTMYYTKYSADGSFGTPQKLDGVPSPYAGSIYTDAGPIYTGGKLVWASNPRQQSKLRFATLDGSGNVKVYGSSGASKTENPFVDVAQDAYYYDGVMWALENSVTTGVDASHFQPGSTCTRGQVVTFLWRAKGCPEPRTQSNPFTDVKSSSPFYKAILWAQENGITTGTTATTFNPGGTCTNGHVLTFLWRTNGQPAASGSSSLASRYPNQYFTSAIGWAQARGILSSDSMNPRSQCPRADIVTYLYRDASNS